MSIGNRARLLAVTKREFRERAGERPPGSTRNTLIQTHAL
jgi:hypothetical protein